MLAQEGTVIIDSDAYFSMFGQESKETITVGTNVGMLDQKSEVTITGEELASHILIANPPPANNGGSPGWAIFS
ncbi:MAG: hypothetical protein OEM46_12180, partial [Ignavibacteria bacterium]|nr:hypothetical protein [Ignavibacteria bacterium]